MHTGEAGSSAVLEHAIDRNIDRPNPAISLLDSKESARRLRSIDALRGIAALAVVLTHIPREHQGNIDRTFLTFLPMDFGTLGVPLFLVISGFCIHLAVARRSRESQNATVDWVAFWKRRFYRLYPPYLAAIGFSLAAYFIVSALGHVRPDRVIESPWLDLGSHLLLVQNLLPAFMDGLFNPAFWTLALEEQLYALFAILLILRRRLSIFSVLAIALAVEVIWRSGATWAEFLLVRNGIPRDAQLITIGPLPAIGGWTAWPFAWWFLWVLGAVAAEGYAKTTPLPGWCYSRLVAVGMATFGALTYFRTLGRYTEFWLTDDGAQGFLRASLNTMVGLSEIAFGVSCFILLNRWVRAEQEGIRAQPWMAKLTSVGVFSYSLYLVHHPVIAVLETLIPLGPRSSVFATMLRILVYVPICVASGYLFFIAVERHFLKHRKGQWTSWARDRAFANWRSTAPPG